MSEPTIGDLLDLYFELGVAEGREGRTHDTIDGAAQKTRHKIAGAIARAREEAAKDALQDSPNNQMRGQDQEFIERVAIHIHNRDADNDTVKWAKQPGKYRAQLRRDVRDVLASLSELGFSVVKTSQATKEAFDV